MSIKQQLEKRVTEHARGLGQAALKNAKCPIHQVGPTNLVHTRIGTSISWTYDACCPELRKVVAKELRKKSS